MYVLNFSAIIPSLIFHFSILTGVSGWAMPLAIFLCTISNCTRDSFENCFACFDTIIIMEILPKKQDKNPISFTYCNRSDLIFYNSYILLGNQMNFRQQVNNIPLFKLRKQNCIWLLDLQRFFMI